MVRPGALADFTLAGTLVIVVPVSQRKGVSRSLWCMWRRSRTPDSAHDTRKDMGEIRCVFLKCRDIAQRIAVFALIDHVILVFGSVEDEKSLLT